MKDGKKMLDLLLTILPRYVTYSDPAAGVSIVNAVAKIAGFKSKTVDFNIMFYNKFKHDLDMFSRIDNWMEMNPANSKGGLNTDRKLNDIDRKELDDVYEMWMDVIEEHQPKYLGFSVFTQWSIKVALEYLPLVRKRFPNIKIILGGPGTSPHNDELYNTVDYYVQGEGEGAIVAILNDETENCPGINGVEPDQMDDMDSIPYPDYSDFNMDDYICKGEMLRITGSRGCIRRCNFCDHYKWQPKFRWRSGKLIADEMLYQWSTLPTKPYRFIFTDSLINGNLRMVREMCNRLIELKAQYNGFDPKWQGYFVIGSPLFFTDDDFDLIMAAGCHNMSLGVESGSYEVRLSMNKKVKDEWFDNHFENAYNRNIDMMWNMFVGFPTETDDDFFKTVALLEKFKWMNEKEGFTILVLVGEFTMSDEIDWVIDNKTDIHFDDNNHWVFTKNQMLVREKRLARLFFIQNKIYEYGYSYRLINLLGYTTDFRNLEQIYIDRYGIGMFGDYDLYVEYKTELEKGYKGYEEYA